MRKFIAYKDIVSLMESYFDGLYLADNKILADVFHSDARYVNMTKGQYINCSRSEYLKIIRQRTPPASQGEQQNNQILSIEFGGSHMAFVKARMSMLGREYLDFLTVTSDDGGWKIMSKIFTYNLQKGEV